MKLFNATHTSKATGNTLLLVYITCLGQKIFTIGLPGKCACVGKILKLDLSQNNEPVNTCQAGPSLGFYWRGCWDSTQIEMTCKEFNHILGQLQTARL